MKENKEYEKWINSLIYKFEKSRIDSMIKLNTDMITLFFELGKEISNSTFKESGGPNYYDRISKDFLNKISSPLGLTPENIENMEKFYLLYKDVIDNSPELFTTTWSYHISILNKCKETDEALFYVNKIYENDWDEEELNFYLNFDLYHKID